MKANILDILKKITSLFAYSKDNKQILGKVVRILAEDLGCEVCSIYAYDEKTDKLVLAATYGLNQNIVGKFSLKPGEGITGKAFLEGEIINLAHPEKSSYFKRAIGSGEEKYNSILSCPLIVGGRKSGVINLQSVKAEPFDPELVEVLKSLSVQIANIIESSKIFNQISATLTDAKGTTKPEEFVSSRILKGIPANQGLVIGRVIFLDKTDEEVDIAPERHFTEEKEIEILEQAINVAKIETEKMAKRALEMITEADASIFGVHLLFLEDKTLIDSIKKLIKEGYSAEYSVKKICDDYLSRFEKMSSEIFREKAADLKDVMFHLIKQIKKLKGHKAKEKTFISENQQEKYIVAAHELLPSDILRIPLGNVAGYICEKGGVTAHFAILARALNIPAMMGVKNLSTLSENDKIILDCYAGLIYVNPSPELESRFLEVLESRKDISLLPDTSEAITKDGRRIYVMANLSLLSEMDLLLKSGADGIGLYRTEFAYMIRDYAPSEEALFSIYSKICAKVPPGGICFRLLDVGSDKALPYLSVMKEENPAMGVRGIRVLARHEEIFLTQIKAILSAAVNVELRILIPMVSGIDQILHVKSIIEKAKSILSEKGVPYNSNYKVGIMIEIPSVVFALDKIIKEIDFGSIGTNDLMQFFFATDRMNEDLSSLASYYEPSFLSLLKQTAKVFTTHKKKLCVCGEMASDMCSIPLLVGMGINELSMNPRLIPSVKRLIRELTYKKCRELLGFSLSCRSSTEVKKLCSEFLRFRE